MEGDGWVRVGRRGDYQQRESSNLLLTMFRDFPRTKITILVLRWVIWDWRESLWWSSEFRGRWHWLSRHNVHLPLLPVLLQQDARRQLPSALLATFPSVYSRTLRRVNIYLHPVLFYIRHFGCVHGVALPLPHPLRRRRRKKKGKTLPQILFSQEEGTIRQWKSA